ncbi:hypothetical protein BCR37DRAFT_399411 [Protomyces lactucae-debilis]|uniref:Dynamitin-domain-containing protein n=1 Tax=Protomyces lactucae-debilis TaxID=2754530 RepID=A0A1Y2F8U6_PROLT|nr:uncharacterized protein BCR37DRAFT_399411 [Protomyces lactucae-debilis]ORY80338.1 hypothetical protein BCR37DRAFT_399411 [Protomyces lactucae-debilis]
MPELHIIQQGFLPLRTTDEPEIFESPAVDSTRHAAKEDDYTAPPEYSSQDAHLIDHAPNDPVVARQFFDRHILLAPVALPNADEVAIRGASTSWQAGRVRETPHERLARLKREVEELSLQQADGQTTTDGSLDELTASLDSIHVKSEESTATSRASQALLQKVSLLEARLSQLEQRQARAQSTGSTPRAALEQVHLSVPQLALLVRQLALLTSKEEDRAALILKLGKLASTAKIINEHPQAAQLESLFSATREIQAHAVLVGPVLDRLRDLADVHHDAANSASVIASLEQSIQERQIEIDLRRL